jgi:DNA-directed RNA polymerase subunit alpha
MTNYDKLAIEIETDGTTTPQAALSQAADILVREFSRFTEIGRPIVPGADEASLAPSANLLDAPIEELDLPMRAYNSLKRNNITKIGQLLALSDDELLRMRNFGQKSLDEMKERLALRGFISPDGAGMASDESDLPASAELDEAAAAELDREA